MAAYDAIRHETYYEVTIEGTVTLPLLREALDEVSEFPKWISLNAMWTFSSEVRPPAFHEFDDIIAMLDKLYARRPVGKRVALVVPDSFSRSVADVFVGLAVRLPVQMRVFGETGAARAWIEG